MQRRPVQYRNRRVVGPSSELVQPDRGLICYLNSELGVGRYYASIDTDPGTWTASSGLQTISDQGGGVYNVEEDASTGAHRVYDSGVLGKNHPGVFRSKCKRSAGTRNTRLRAGDEYADFDPGGAGVFNEVGTATGSISGPDVDGYYSLEIVCTSVTGSQFVYLQLLDGVSTSYAGDNTSGYLVKDIAVTQVLGSDIYSQPPATGPVASNINTAAMPYYGDGTGGLVGDGVDDYLQFASGLGSHTTHTWVICAAIPAAALNSRVVSASSPLNFGRYGATGRIAVSDGVAYKEIIGSAGAYGPTVFTVLLDAGPGTCAIRVNGIDQPLTSSAYTPRDLNGTVRLFSNFAGGSFSDANLYGAAFYDRILSAGELRQAERFIGAIGGIVL